MEARQLTCSTRALKNAKHLQKVAPHLIPEPETQGYFGHIPMDTLARLSESPDARARAGLAGLAGLAVPAPAGRAAAPLFNGSLYFLHIRFVVLDEGKTVHTMSDADFATAVEYARLACEPISEYASRYGKNSLTPVTRPVLFSVDLPTARYNDVQLQGWVDQVAGREKLPGDACLVVLNPLGVVNTDGDPAKGIGGYHSARAGRPYIFVNVLGKDLTVSDPPFAFAGAVSHEIAEMTVDPAANLVNPEVCDPCGPNCVSTYLDYFDHDGTYIATSQDFPPPFPYTFFINGIVKPAYATLCPSPKEGCTYGPTYADRDVLEAFPAGSVVSVAGYYADVDKLQHVIVATTDGTIHERWFPGHGAPGGSGNLQAFPAGSVVSVAGYYADVDKLQHVIVATTDGTIHERWFPGHGAPGGSGNLQAFPAGSVVSVAGYYADVDKLQHVIVATTDGTIHERWFPGHGAPGGSGNLQAFPAGSVVSVAGYYADVDKLQHVIVATTDGTIHERWFPGHGAPGGSGTLASFPPGTVVSVAGYYADIDKLQHVIVATTDGTIHERWFPGHGAPGGLRVRGRVPSTIGVSGYAGLGDGFEHAIAATNEGEVHELYW